MNKYTVILSLPTDIRGDQCCAADEITREHVHAPDWSIAVDCAIDKTIAHNEYENKPDEFAPLAVYEGHLFDLLEV